MKRSDHQSRTTPVIDPQQVRASDIMRPEVLVLRADDPIRDAAEQLEEARASGAPVVDAAGRLLGVLTISDIARSEHIEDGYLGTMLESHAETQSAGEDESVDEALFPTDTFRADIGGRARVADWMTRGVTHVALDESLATICRVMLDQDIHRVFVLDRGRLRGVVSTKDVVRLLAAPPREPAATGHRRA